MSRMAVLDSHGGGDVSRVRARLHVRRRVGHGRGDASKKIPCVLNIDDDISIHVPLIPTVKLIEYFYGKYFTQFMLFAVPSVLVSILTARDLLGLMFTFYFSVCLWLYSCVCLATAIYGAYRYLSPPAGPKRKHASFAPVRQGLNGFLTCIFMVYFIALFVQYGTAPWWLVPGDFLLGYITDPLTWLPWGPFVMLLAMIVI